MLIFFDNLEFVKMDKRIFMLIGTRHKTKVKLVVIFVITGIGGLLKKYGTPSLSVQAP